jgi:1-acyl-sn-glycerol-3-phosphate acyltransferase
MLDIVSLFEVMPWFVWVSKIENFKMPILGTVMKLNGYIQLVREDPRSFPIMFNACTRELQKGNPILFFPEGTRSKTGQMGRFKEGAFKVALENNVSIIPIVMDGIEQAGLKFSFVGGFKIKVLEEVTPDKFPSRNPVELKDFFKEMMVRELEYMRKE